MTDRHHSYRTKKDRKKPVTFSIEDETFRCHPVAPGTLLIEHASKMMSIDLGVQLAELLAFLELVMPEDEYKRFREFADDPSNEVDIDLLGDIVADMLREYGVFPTRRRSPSEDGRSKTGTTSTGDSPSPDSTSSSSQPTELQTSSTP